MDVDRQDLKARKEFVRFVGQMFAGERDLNETLGYPDELDFKRHLYPAYKRYDIARRIVRLPAEMTWKEPPEITEDSATDTEFTAAWDTLASDDDLQVWHYLERADRIAGIGRFGVLLLGVAEPDTDPTLDQPLEADSLDGPDALVYLSAFHEGSCEVAQYDGDVQSPRYGMPEFYRITMVNEDGYGTSEREVHWTRVLHLAEGLDESEVFGTPRLMEIFNRIWDLQKIAGSAPEIFWKAALRRVFLDLDPEADPDPEDLEAVEQEVQEMWHGLKDWAKTRGMDPKTIDSHDVHPKETYEVLISLIAGAKGFPQRILTGSERGDLASVMDAANFYGQMSARQQKYAEPRILRAFINRCMWLGILPAVEQYEVEWPPLFELTKPQKATIAKELATAMKKLTSSPLSDLTTPEEARSELFQWPAEPPEEFAENLLEELIDEDETVVEQVMDLAEDRDWTFAEALHNLALANQSDANG